MLNIRQILRDPSSVDAEVCERKVNAIHNAFCNWFYAEDEEYALDALRLEVGAEQELSLDEVETFLEQRYFSPRSHEGLAAFVDGQTVKGLNEAIHACIDLRELAHELLQYHNFSSNK